MKKKWQWLRDPDNRGALIFICSVVTLLCTGVWTIFSYIMPALTNPKIQKEPFVVQKKEEASSQASVVNNIDNFENGTHFEAPVPRRVGNDVLIPLIILQRIPHFDESKPVYAATYKNDWLRSYNSEDVKIAIMRREGNEWRAIGLAGTRFHPAQFINPVLPNNENSRNNISFVPIEDLKGIYGNKWAKFTKEFIDPNPPGPLFLIR